MQPGMPGTPSGARNHCRPERFRARPTASRTFGSANGNNPTWAPGESTLPHGGSEGHPLLVASHSNPLRARQVAEATPAVQSAVDGAVASTRRSSGAHRSTRRGTHRLAHRRCQEITEFTPLDRAHFSLRPFLCHRGYRCVGCDRADAYGSYDVLPWAKACGPDGSR